MPKTVEDLEKSRVVRQNIINKYGTVFESVWYVDYTLNELVDDIVDSQGVLAPKKHKWLKYDKSMYKIFCASGKTVRGKNAGLSIFPYDLARKIIRYWSEPGDLILDPCHGHATRLTASFREGRSYIGYDVCELFCAHNRKVKADLIGEGNQILLDDPDTTVTLHQHTSEKMFEKDNSVDMIFTSPPYWDIEFYGAEKEQLGLGKSYKKFMKGIERIISECYRVLKPGRFIIFNINDFRKDNRFYMYHADIADTMKTVGFELFDCIVIKWTNSIGACFASQIETRKYTAKAHEYLVVAKKPGKARQIKVNDHDSSGGNMIEKFKVHHMITKEKQFGDYTFYMTVDKVEGIAEMNWNEEIIKELFVTNSLDKLQVKAEEGLEVYKKIFGSLKDELLDNIKYTKVKPIKFDKKAVYSLKGNDFAYVGRCFWDLETIFNGEYEIYIPNVPTVACVISLDKKFVVVIAPHIAPNEDEIKYLEQETQMTIGLEEDIW